MAITHGGRQLHRRSCLVSPRPAVPDGRYGVDPRGPVSGGPAHEDPAGGRRGVPRWACAGERSACKAGRWRCLTVTRRARR